MKSFDISHNLNQNPVVLNFTTFQLRDTGQIENIRLSENGNQIQARIHLGAAAEPER